MGESARAKTTSLLAAMKISPALSRRLRWLHFPTLTLVALLQRTPVLRSLVVAEEMVISSRIGSLLKAAVSAIALGGLHSRAGATTLVTNESSPLMATVGTAIPTVAFGLSGTDTPASTWSVSGSLPPGVTLNGRTALGQFSGGTLVLSGTPTAAGTFQINISGSDQGFVSPSFPYTIIVTGGSTAAAPSFTTQPQSQTVAAGGSATFTVAVSGSPTPTLQWRKDGTAIAGQTGTSLTLTNVTNANAGAYSAVATNSAGSATSNGATLTVTTTVNVAPTITAQPISVTVVTGQKVALVVGASGSGLNYQWRTAGGPIVGATSPLLVLPSASAADAGAYFCRVTNASGTVDSAAATLNVVASAGTPGYLRALSLRGNVGAGADAFFVGFVTEGSGQSSVLVKGNGPGLATLFNVPGVLADPRLDVVNAASNVAVGSNDNWGGTTDLLNANNAAAAFPLPDPTSKDAVMRADLNPGTYIAKVSGVNNTTGVALVEIYGLSVPANLRALSLRGNAGAGADAFFLGIIIAGDTAKTVLVKSIGPGLATLFNVPGAMVDPKLEISNASTSQVLGENDNWSGAAEIKVANDAVAAFPLNDATSKDSAMLITLPPGAYIAKVAGTANTTGVVLVEIYGL
jgi:hypothetical protein